MFIDNVHKTANFSVARKLMEKPSSWKVIGAARIKEYRNIAEKHPSPWKKNEENSKACTLIRETEKNGLCKKF